MGAQLSRESGMPIVNCESCHGPGSLAIEGITPEKVARTPGLEADRCDYRTLVDMKKIPAQAKSLICLKCHTANATFNLHNCERQHAQHVRRVLFRLPQHSRGP